MKLQDIKRLCKRAPKYQNLAEINHGLFLMQAKGRIEKVCKNIELLHGVPVDMPDEFIEKIWNEVEFLIENYKLLKQLQIKHGLKGEK